MNMKESFVNEKTGIEYIKKGDYYIPNLSVPKDTNFVIGKYGKAHLKYIKKHNCVLVTDLLLNGKLNSYLHSIDENCKNLLEKLIKEFAQKENVTEDLKSNNQLEWVAKMNNIKNRAEEIVFNEYVYV